MSIFWDQRYRNNKFAYGKEPNQFFAEIIDNYKPKKLLLPAEGEGRNAVYAATKGWQVDAFDFSPIARDNAIALAHEHGVSINYFLADFNFLALPEKTYHFIALIYTHMPSQMRLNVHRTLVKSLKPGGILMAELFSKKQLDNESGGPKNPDYLITCENLAHDFAGMKIKLNEEKKLKLDEGPFHQGEAEVVRFLARK
jgi:SAM-dependent methyltransferase